MADGNKVVKVGSPERPLRVAIIGSGPSGFYAAEALLNAKDLAVQVDMFDRLPTPYGLVRGGVAPDHQKIKNVTMVYEKIAARPAFRFFGNVMLGRDIQVDDLRRHYDHIVYAVGNESDRRLKVPGEDLKGSHSATAFVGWYNGHPDWRKEDFDLSQESAAVIGIGNVAIDVTRILAEDVEVLAKTDMARHAVEALRGSRVKTVWLLGRRGPVQAAFSPAELKELCELHSSDLVVREDELKLDEVSRAALEKDPEAKKNYDLLVQQAKKGEGSRPRKICLRFCVSPTELIEGNGRVAKMKLEINQLVADGKGGLKAQGTGQTEVIDAGLVFRSVGYHGVPIPGVPFDAKAGHIPNKDGRVLDDKAAVVAGAYVVGWAKRGPSGLIGTNRADSVLTVKAMLEDVAKLSAPVEESKTPEAALATVKARQPDFVTFQDWKLLETLELSRGKQSGKIREKFTTVAEMLEAIKKARQEACLVK
ncbi:MAG: FAD-dependent oxidoreductase [Elusimicrobia bacterium]|nr:FAD-dependent oxidoreductase [Elusimicrobiota bacterium]